MNISKFYTQDSSENWFATAYQSISVHDSLKQKNYRIFDKSELNSDLVDVNMPIELVKMSWDSLIPRPRQDLSLTRIAAFPFQIKSDRTDEEAIAENITRWMNISLTGPIYLVSLNPTKYLVAMSDKAEYTDALAVVRTWDIDSYIGIFDATGSTLFYFDAEFNNIFIASKNSSVPNEFKEFAASYDEYFEANYTDEAKVRTGTDPRKAAEYFEKIAS